MRSFLKKSNFKISLKHFLERKKMVRKVLRFKTNFLIEVT